MYFDVSEMKQNIKNYKLLTQAKLRLRLKDMSIQSGLSQRLEIYKGLGSSAKYLGFHDISHDLQYKWISFDITATLKDWLQSPGK